MAGNKLNLLRKMRASGLLWKGLKGKKQNRLLKV
jgi:hypothetical protein